MMNILYLMHRAHQKLTLSNVIDITGMTRGGVIETIELLVRRGILTETLGRNSMGRGTARQFEFSPQVLPRLVVPRRPEMRDFTKYVLYSI